MLKVFTSPRLAIALLALGVPLAAQAYEEPRPMPRNLILEGRLPGATLLRIGNLGGKESDSTVLTLANGRLQNGVTVATGEERVLELTAEDADGKLLYQGEVMVDARSDEIPQVVLEFKSTLDGAAAEVTLASHRIAVEFAAIEREGKTYTRLVADVFNADGLRLELKEGELAWGIDDPRIGENLMPCPILSGRPTLCVEFEPLKRGEFARLDVCYRKHTCIVETLPPRPRVWRSVTVGNEHHACALKLDGNAYCWGQGEHGQLGSVAPKNCSVYVNTAVKPWGCNETATKVECAGGNCQFTQISAGMQHTCAIDNAQDAWCWGGNFYGELGDGSRDTTRIGSPQPRKVAIGGGLRFQEIRAGYHVTCGLTTSHEVYCWGNNALAIVPHGTSSPEPLPVQIPLPGDAESLDLTYNSACARVTGGDLFCWGANTHGNIGSAPFVSATNCRNCPAAPVLMQSSVSGLMGRQVSLVAAGAFGSCAHLTNDQTTCWGLQGVAVPPPAPLELLTYGYRHYCALSRGNVICAGAAALGDGGEDTVNGYGPVRPSTPTRYFHDVDTGMYQTCAVGRDERIYCWGDGTFGALGDGGQVSSKLPVEVFFLQSLPFPVKIVKQ